MVTEADKDKTARLAFYKNKGGDSYKEIGELLGVTAPTAKRLVERGQNLQHDSQEDHVVELREVDKLSWRAIAEKLNLGTPGTARRVYRDATGLEGPFGRLPGKGGRSPDRESAEAGA